MDPSSEAVDVLDDRPIAVRRKRRTLTITSVDNGQTATNSQRDARQASPRKTKPISVTSTPRKKRVRFSDPGPEIVPSTTGLTPALRRHGLAPNSPNPCGKSPRHLRRRHSSPGLHMSSPPPLVGLLQFAPLRQIIDGRSKRRLRRNHLSEEMNRIEEENKQLEHKLDRSCLATQKKGVDGPHKAGRGTDVEIGTPMPSCEAACGVTEEILGRESSVAPELTTQQYEDMMCSLLSFASNIDLSFNTADNEGRAEGEGRAATDNLSSGASKKVANSSTQAEISSPRQMHLEEQLRLLKQSLQTVTSNLEVSNAINERLCAKIHAHLQDSSSSSSNSSELDEALDNILTSLVLAQSRAEDAEAGLSTLSSEVKKLGFEGNDVEGMLKTINSQFRQARLELEYLQPGETEVGFENAKILGLLVDRVRLLIQRIRDGAEEQDNQKRVAVVLQEQFDHAEARVHELAADVEEKERSISNLQRALNGYRSEVTSLETLVNRLESEHKAAANKLQKSMDEAVADLEVKLGAEIHDKEEMAREAEDRKRLIESLQKEVDHATDAIRTMTKEKDTLLAAKDKVVSKLVAESAAKSKTYESDLAERNNEISSLRQDKSTLEDSLAEAEISIGTLTAANTTLEIRLASDIEEGVRAMEAMQTEMMRSLARVAEIKNTYINSGKVATDEDGIALPATPCSLRFRNTPKKKRRKVDSGIGVLEEDVEMFDV